MSGGSYDYAYRHVDEMADELSQRRHTPLRRAFAAHMKLVAKAMHAIEWEDSGDGADDVAAMKACLSNPTAAELAVVRRDAVEAAELLARLLEGHKP
jgi:hypothetical protein